MTYGKINNYLLSSCSILHRKKSQIFDAILYILSIYHLHWIKSSIRHWRHMVNSLGYNMWSLVWLWSIYFKWTLEQSRGKNTGFKTGSLVRGPHHLATPIACRSRAKRLAWDSGEKVPLLKINIREVFLLMFKIWNTLCDKDAFSVGHGENHIEPIQC